jgi:hypothetical protein
MPQKRVRTPGVPLDSGLIGETLAFRSYSASVRMPSSGRALVCRKQFDGFVLVVSPGAVRLVQRQASHRTSRFELLTEFHGSSTPSNHGYRGGDPYPQGVGWVASVDKAETHGTRVSN